MAGAGPHVPASMGFGLAEAVLAPLFVQLQFLDSYEGYDVPAGLTRVRASARGVHGAPCGAAGFARGSREALLRLRAGRRQRRTGDPARARSSFVFEPRWSKRPWPPPRRVGPSPSDEALGLL